MKITIERSALVKVLGNVQSIVERNNMTPILNNIMIEAGESELQLTATDMSLTIVDSAIAEVGEMGTITVPGHLLHDIVRKMPNGIVITMEVVGHQIIIKAKRSRFKLPTLPREDFPATKYDAFTYTFTVRSADMIKMIDDTQAAISTEETRYYLRGMYLCASGDMLHAVATDGARLARCEIPLPEGAAGIPGVIIPGKTVNELFKLLTDVDDKVEVALSENQIRFTIGDVVLTSKLISGTFPDYERVIPKDNDKIVLMDCQEFSNAIDLVSTICSEKTRVVKLKIAAGTLTLSTYSPEHGTATEEIEIDYDGPEIEIGFNSRFLLDITRQIEGQIKITFSDPQGAAVLNAVDDSSSLYVLMAMRF